MAARRDAAQAAQETARLGISTVVKGVATGIIEIGAATPLVSPICLALLKAKEIVDEARINKKALAELCEQCEMITVQVIDKASKTSTIDVSPLEECVHKLEEVAKRSRIPGPLSRLVQPLRAGHDIQRLHARIRDIVSIMGLGFVLDDGKKLDQILARLQPRPKLAPVPPGVPMGQSWYAMRDGKVDRVYDILGGEGGPAVAALTGRSGAGKTTAAIAMVGERGPIRPRAGETDDQARTRLDRVRARFSDGVVWLRVGKGAGAADRLPDLMHKLAKALHEDVLKSHVNAPEAGEAGDSYAKKVVEQESLRCLVVADDVWESRVVKKLRETGMWVLVTTREPSMVEPNERVLVDKLEAAEAEDVLRGAAELPSNKSLCNPARKVLEICGHVAMDIAFVGRWSSVRTASGVPKSNMAWARTVEEIEAQGGGVDVEREVNRLAVLRAGFEYLASEDPLAQTLYVVLAAFHDRHAFGESDAAVLLNEKEAAMDMISILERWGVLRADNSGRYRMHDAHMEFARDELMDWENVRKPAIERWTTYREHTRKPQEMASPCITGEQLTNITDSIAHLSAGRPTGANLLAETYACGEKRVRGFHLCSDHPFSAERIGERFLNALMSAARGIRFRGWTQRNNCDNHAELSSDEGQAVLGAVVGGEDLATFLPPQEGPPESIFNNAPLSAMSVSTRTKAGSKEADALGMCAAIECRSDFNRRPHVEGKMCHAFNSCAVTLWEDEDKSFRPVLWMIARDYFDGAVNDDGDKFPHIDRFVAIVTLSAILAEKGVPRPKQQLRCYASSLQHEYGDLINLPSTLTLSKDTFAGGWWGKESHNLTVGWEVGGVFMKFTGSVIAGGRAHTAGPVVDAVRREKPPDGGWLSRTETVIVGRSDWTPRFFDRNKVVTGIVKLLSSASRIEGPGAVVLFEGLARLVQEVAPPTVGNPHHGPPPDDTSMIPDFDTLRTMPEVAMRHFSGGRLLPQWSVLRRIAWLQLHWANITALPYVPKALPMLLAVCAQSGAVCAEMIRVGLLSSDLIRNPLRNIEDIPWLVKQKEEPTLVEFSGLRGWLFAFLENDYNSDPSDDVGKVTGCGFAPKLARDGIVTSAVFGTLGSPILLGLRWAQYGLEWDVRYWTSKTGVNVSPGNSVSGTPVLAHAWGMSWVATALPLGAPVYRSLRHRDGAGRLAVADNTEVDYCFNGWAA